MADAKKVTLEVAVEAYRDWERKQLAAEKAYHNLNLSVRQLALIGGDQGEYYRLTEEIRAEYEEKRAKSIDRKKLVRR